MKTKFDREKIALLSIVGEGFLSRLSFGLVSFALPLYALHLGMSLPEIAFLDSINVIVALALKPLAGWVADRFGLKRSFTIAVSLRQDFGRVEDQGWRIVRIIDRNRDLVLEQKQDACK